MFLKLTFLLGTFNYKINLYCSGGEIMNSFAKRFKHLRENTLGLTQDQLAEILGVSRATIAGYESEEKKRIPRKETLQKIANKFDVSIDWLLTGEEQRFPKALVKQNLPRIRERFDISIKELSKNINISEDTIINWEEGVEAPTGSQVDQINQYIASIHPEYKVALNEKKLGTKDFPVLLIKSIDTTLTSEEHKLLEEIKKYPVLFHDFANAPEKKKKQLIKMWEIIKSDYEDDDDDGEIIED